jgi:hypothetical protein
MLGYVRRSEPYEAMVDLVGIIQMMENRMEREDHTMAKIVRPKGPTPCRVREYMKYAVRPSTTAACDAKDEGEEAGEDHIGGC